MRRNSITLKLLRVIKKFISITLAFNIYIYYLQELNQQWEYSSMRAVDIVVLLSLFSIASYNEGKGVAYVLAGLTSFMATEVASSEWKYVPRSNVFTMMLAFYQPTIYMVAIVICTELNRMGFLKSRDNILTIKEHGYQSTIAALAVDIMGTTLVLDYIGDVDLNREVMDSYGALRNIKVANDSMGKTWQAKRYIVMMLVALTSGLLGGSRAFLVASIVMLMQASLLKGQEINSKTVLPDVIEHERITMPEGLYRVVAQPFGITVVRGVAYCRDGTLYTRKHVTQCCPIEMISGQVLKPCYINDETDNIAYGAAPQYAKVDDGDEVIVALAGPRARNIVTYKTQASVDAQGMIVFRGSKSIPGTSGSPVFKKVSTAYTTEDGIDRSKVTHEYVGSVGWHWSSDPDPEEHGPTTGVELMKEDPRAMKTSNLSLEKGEIRQIFKHPGAGKTRIDMPGLVSQGVNLYGKVYVTGPSRVVCNELFSSLKNSHADSGVSFSLVTSDATVAERSGASVKNVMVGAHAHMHTMILKNDPRVSKPGLWIMDESHYLDTSSMCLKDELRELASKGKITLVEMTATGYNLSTNAIELKEGSNYHIEDITMEAREMINNIVEEEGKVVVFVTSIKGKETTSSTSLKKTLERFGRPFIELNRATFSKKYADAQNMVSGVILTTDIAECGANLGRVDVVYDFQETPKPIAGDRQVEITNTVIDQAQRIQRRGRVGRVMEGRYISPNYNLKDVDLNRAEHVDRAIYAKARGIRIREPCVPCPSDINLTQDQVVFWRASAGDGIASAYTVALVTDSQGHVLQKPTLKQAIIDWKNDDRVVHAVDGKVYNMSHWDARDEKIHKYWLDCVMVASEKGDLFVDVWRKVREMTPKVFRSGDALLKAGSTLKIRRDGDATHGGGGDPDGDEGIEI
uniref:Genome polyprotein n=1 Tax=Plasmopara viticola lesion associated Jingmen-like virus 1 TaxID=2692079 RepID=A0A6B9Q4X1_9FLAV|nr:NS3 [Plasmopara viticola lesion associated Jingman-like virus 1]